MDKPEPWRILVSEGSALELKELLDKIEGCSVDLKQQRPERDPYDTDLRSDLSIGLATLGISITVAAPVVSAMCRTIRDAIALYLGRKGRVFITRDKEGRETVYVGGSPSEKELDKLQEEMIAHLGSAR